MFLADAIYKNYFLFLISAKVTTFEGLSVDDLGKNMPK